MSFKISKCKAGKILGCFLLIGVLFFAQNQIAFEAYAASYSSMFAVKNYNGCTNLGCIARNGSTLYALKVNSDNNKGALYTVKDYSSSSRSITKTAIGSVGHGNGMCYYDGNLYVAGGTSDLWRVSTAGKITKVTTTGGYNLWNITHYKSNQFILKVAKDGDYLKYGIATLSGTKMTFTSYFYVKNTGYSTNQDIFYAGNGHLLIVTSADNLKQNTILDANITGSAGTYKNLKCYTPVKKITINGSSSYSKFEVEGVCTSGSGTPVICLNMEKSSDTNLDSVYKIPDLSY